MARYAIRGLDMAGDTVEELVQFLMVAQKNVVTVDFTSIRGPNGYPVANLYSFTRGDMDEVIMEYCGGDRITADVYMDMFDQVAD
ncbi:MAG: hypothetical protein EBR73_17210 [Rhodobacteraceae bacterium]|nr:hypothetical protein [Paracoccaceae bacterium]